MDIKKDPLINGVAYGLATIGTCVAIATGSHPLEFICKPLLMIILSSWFFFNSRRYGDRFTVLVQVGLFFSLVGDTAMMFQYKDEFNFLIGLGAFLIAQLCFVMAFVRNIIDVGGLDAWLLGGSLSILVALYAILFSWQLLQHVDETMSVPVTCYVVAIALMGITAALRHGRTFARSFWMVFAGALLFICSDSILAIDRFVRPFGWGPVTVIITYASGQFLIAAGCLQHVLDPETILRKKTLEEIS